MIRFSAALVAVAIGVLIGGIATSELVLVYIAIVVSAVALAVLAIGVMLKRDELFGEGQGLVPAGAGTGPVLSAQAGPQNQHSQVTQRSQASPSLPVRESAAPAAGALRADTARAKEAARATAFSSAGRPAAGPSASATAPAPVDPAWSPDHLRSADQAPSWETSTATSSARGSWTPAQDIRPDWTRTAAAQAPAPAPPVPEPPAPEPATQATPASWFERLGEPASNAWSVPSPAPSSVEPGTGIADENDDEPARYSWLDDLDDDANAPGENDLGENHPGEDAPGESAEPLVGDPTAAIAALTPDSPVDAAVTDPADAELTDAELTDTAPADTAPADTAPADTAPADTAPADLDDTLQAAETTSSPKPVEVTDPEDTHAEAVDSAATYADVADTAAEAIDTQAIDTQAIDADATYADATYEDATGADATGADATGAEATYADATYADATSAESVGTEVTDAEATGTAEAAGQATTDVAVVRGVPRYHEPDCVLIRFMPEADTQRMSIPDAKSTGCTPCAACQPPG